ncbi:MAG: ATP-binding cassette domain-containing protein, partial [Thiothrix sp.]|nr:ATP-binding cassette domain-containing protein [Thiothrix sp.]
MSGTTVLLTIRNLHLLNTHTRQPLPGPLDFGIAAGEILTLMGPSGLGKSTLLNWIVGALPDGFQAQGELWLDGVRLDHLPTEQRRIGILFQDDLLFPHLSVGGNLAFALPGTRHAGRQQRRARIEQVLADAGLAGFYERDPHTLSGGQRARISVLRTLLAEPRAILLDEPFSRLDTELR